MDFLAKDNGITLREHSLNVYKQVSEILDISGIENIELINICKICALVHDCGKTASVFQQYCLSKEGDKFPRHNEIGFALLRVMIDASFGLYSDSRKWYDLICYSVLFHHETYNIKCNLSELYNNEELKKISKYYNELFEHVGLSSVIRFKNDFDVENEDEFFIGDVKAFKFINDENNKRSLRKLRDFEVIFNIIRYSDLLVSSNMPHNDKRFSYHTTNKEMIFPSYFDRARWDEQCEKADEAFAKNFAILEATMGWGKTLSGINYLLHSDKKGFWVCPDNALCRATYNNICRTLKECGIEDLKVSLLLSGSWEGCDIVNADIIVTNIDTYVNGVFRNSRKIISYEALFCNCIFDEYHEYAFHDNPLLPRFISIIKARECFKGIKTLFLSGTIINKGYIDTENIITANKLELDKIKKVNIHFLDREAFNAMNDFDNSFIINTRIKSCQDLYNIKHMNYCYHSEFDDEDSKNIIQNIMKHNGKNGDEHKCSVSSTSVYSRGYDLSHTQCFLINPSPLTPEQAGGRLNRWDISTISDMYIIIDDNHNDTMIHGESWAKYYLPYLNFLKERTDGKTVSFYDLKMYRKEFFENESTHSFQKMIKDNMKKGLELLVQIEFCKGAIICEKEGDVSHIKDSVDVRGKTSNRFFIVQRSDKEFGVTSGVINLPCYRFGGDDTFANLRNNPYIIDNIIRYFSINPDIIKKYDDIKNIKRWKPHNLFKYLLYKAKSSETPFPILCDYTYNSEIGFRN